MGLVEEVQAAYGVDAWRAADRLMVIFSAGGAALAPTLRPSAVRCRTGFLPAGGFPSVILDPFPEVGSTGVIRDGEPQIQGSRPAVTGVRATQAGRQDLAVLKVAATALWTWIALPFFLDHPEVRVVERDGRRLEVVLSPRRWPASSASHLLELDSRGRIVRHRERWPVMGRDVAVEHTLSGHCDFNGVLVATARRSRWLWTDLVAAALIPKIPSRPLN